MSETTWRLLDGEGEEVYPHSNNDLSISNHCRMQRISDGSIFIAVDYEKIRLEMMQLVSRGNISVEEMFECLAELENSQYG